MKTIIPILASVLTLPLAADPAAEAKPATTPEASAKAKSLAGTYEIVSGQHGDKKIPTERLEGKVRWGVKTITGYDEDENELYAATYTLDTSATPWTIHMTGTIMPTDDEPNAKEFRSKGLVKAEGDRVTLIYSLEDGRVPDDFEPEAKDHKFVFTKADEK